MMASWMLYAVLLAVLLGLSARVGEWLLRGAGRPGRWVWSGALATSLALPAWARWGPLPSPDLVEPSSSGTLTPELMSPLGGLFTASGPTPLATLDPWLKAGWTGASVVLLLWLGGGLLRLTLQARGWPRIRIADQEVLVSRRFGPALLGLRRPRVVLPRWSLELDDPSLHMVLLHEREHARAGDGILLLLATFAVAVAPWNPALWWQLRRLRTALEVDCDDRVLRRGIPRAEYGRLLLSLGAAEHGGTLAVAGLARPASILERRLTMMAHGVRRGSVARRLAAGLLTATLVVVACETPAPTVSEMDAEGALPVPVSAPDAAKLELTVPAGASPLIFVDGVRAAAMPDDLGPEEIARVEVLKDEPSRRLYGPEAEHGVVRIWTKAGDRGPAVPEGEPAFTAREIPPEEARPEVEGAVTLVAGELTLSSPADGMGRSEPPEIYVDGVLFNGDLAQIDKERIERIDVRKGESGGPSRIEVYLKR